MNTKENSDKGFSMQLKEAWVTRIRKMPFLLLLALHTCVHAQYFNYTINNGAVTITEYTRVGWMGPVTIPGTINGLPVTSIGDYAFSRVSLETGQNSLWVTSVAIPNTVTNIGNHAFENSPYLFNVALGSSVARIGDWAFAGCDILSSILIPGSVTSIGGATFSYCTNLQSINVSINNPVYSSAAGVLFNKSQTTLVAYPVGRVGSYTVPNGVLDIGYGAFYTCNGLNTVTIPSTVTILRDSAFAECENLVSLTIPDSVISVGEFAFSGCESLTNVTIGNGVTRIAAWAFDNCWSLKSIAIPNSVTSIGAWAFQYCYSLTNVAIGSGVISISGRPFAYCGSLTAITVDAANSAYSSREGVLLNKNQTTVVLCPEGKAGDYSVPNGITVIGNEAFSSCKGLSSLTMPDSVTTIGNQAFYYCINLTNVTVGSGVTNIGDLGFCGCASLKGVYFGGNAPSFLGGSYVFQNAPNATIYYLPGNTGWGPTFGGRPTVPGAFPEILTQRASQTVEIGTTLRLRVTASGSPAPTCYWRFNSNVVSDNTNSLLLTNVQIDHAGTYTVEIGNGFGSVTSSPAMLSVILPVERRMVPGIELPGEIASQWQVEVTESFGPPLLWRPIEPENLTEVSHYYLDLTQPLPAQRFYRTQNTSSIPSVSVRLNMQLVPALTLYGNPGDRIRVDGINQFGPTDAWFTLDTVTLTNTSQPYFDTSAVGQPARLYRLLPVP